MKMNKKVNKHMLKNKNKEMNKNRNKNMNMSKNMNMNKNMNTNKNMYMLYKYSHTYIYMYVRSVYRVRQNSCTVQYACIFLREMDTLMIFSGRPFRF
jgi:hypothetical protein